MCRHALLGTDGYTWCSGSQKRYLDLPLPLSLTPVGDPTYRIPDVDALMPGGYRFAWPSQRSCR